MTVYRHTPCTQHSLVLLPGHEFVQIYFRFLIFSSQTKEVSYIQSFRRVASIPEAITQFSPKAIFVSTPKEQGVSDEEHQISNAVCRDLAFLMKRAVEYDVS